MAKDSDVQIDIITYADWDMPLADEARKLGCKIFVCPNHHNPLALFKKLNEINRESGPYIALHAHSLYYNGLVLLCAKLLGIPARISLSHNSALGQHESVIRRIYNLSMRVLIHLVATHLLAVSAPAGRKLYGKLWGKDRRSGLLYCGINFDRFAPQKQSDPSFRAELGIPQSAKVVGHVGRFLYQKNHTFLVESMAEAMRKKEDLWLLLVGDGILRLEIEEQAKALGISNRTVFAGIRSDIPKILVNCVDLFVMPSHFEGLPLVLLEAQGAGNKILVSDNVTKEVDVLPELIERLSLSETPQLWADTVISLVEKAPPISRAEAYEKMVKSHFSIQESFRAARAVWMSKATLANN